MNSLEAFALAKLAVLEQRGTRRRLVETWRDGAVTARRDGRQLVSFCCNDYLNLSQHPAVKRAAAEAVETYGAGAAASRLVTGNHPLYAVLEARLAGWKRTEAALVFGSGYLANISIVPALAGARDLILVDEWAHSCLMAGTRLSGAMTQVFRHNDLGHLQALLEQERGRHEHCLILTDRVFSMDGDLAPVAEMAVLAHAHDAWLMTDDAHGAGLLPPLDPAEVPLQMGTLSKTLGSYGGYLCAAAAVIELLVSRARGFIYTTGLPPASVAAALAALDVIATDPGLGALPLARARQFAELLGLPRPDSQIVPLIVGHEAAALGASERLRAQGFLVAAIRPPTVPAGTARLRFTFTAAHSEAQVAALAAAVREIVPA
ncbi:MAG TPA: aminotransferase class I/II-fold pyridoxal phosphate-dependent enzyme [Aliidongia sp.]|nr:aminotransferase class I/II-fold pyridoxal phosphate-dependent enzyme [Aliidongia sp.]